MLLFRRLVLASLLIVAGGGVASAQTSYNTTLFGKLNPAPGQQGRYSALTGYAAPDGREYALLGGYEGTHIIDVTELPLREVAFIPGPESGWREMKTYGTYAYVVSEGGGGLQIIDLSLLPASAALVQADTRYIEAAHTVSQEGHYLYVNGSYSNNANGGTMIFDLLPAPDNPTLIGMWTDRYVHDATIRNDTMYASAINDGQLDIIYLGADRRNPRFVREIRYPGAGTHNADLTTDGSYIMTTDEIGTTEKTLKFWDLRNPDAISKVADFTAVPGEIVHNVHTLGSYAFVAWYTAGTRIIDISNPREPVEVGYYDTYPGGGPEYAGNWETYPYLPSGKILASDMQTGLVVFTFDGAASGAVHGTVVDDATGLPIPGAVIELPALGRTITADAQGRFIYTGAIDTLAYRASALNYQIGTGNLIVRSSSDQGGQDQTIRLRSMALVSLSLRVLDGTSNAPLGGFTYSVGGRNLEGLSQSNPQVLAFPQDSSYTITVGAWGYIPRTIEVLNHESEIVEVKLQRGYVDDARLDLGWMLSGPTDDAATGAWERGPTVQTNVRNDVAQPGSDRSPGADNYAFITGLRNSQGPAGANDVDSGRTTLTSPEFDLSPSRYGDPHLTVSIWYSNTLTPNAIDDLLRLQISNDGGDTWTDLAEIGTSTDAWKDLSFRLASTLALTARMKFRVIASDLGDPSLVEAGVDDFRIVERGVVGVDDESAIAGRASVKVLPNPIATAGTIRVTLPATASGSRLELFDARGARVAVIHEGAIAAGETSFVVDVASLPAGRYSWRLATGGGVSEGPVVVVR